MPLAPIIGGYFRYPGGQIHRNRHAHQSGRWRPDAGPGLPFYCHFLR